MAEQHDETGSSSGPDKTEPEANETEQVEAEAAEAEVVSEGEASDVAAVASGAPKKKKKKRALAEDPGPSRDRNKRLREEMAEGGRRTKQGSRAIPARNLEAGEIVDDALARTTQAAGEWLKKNANVVQWVVIVVIVGWVGYAVYGYRANRAAEQASAKLSTAIRSEGARIGAADDSKPDPQTGLVETRPTYATEALRLQEAEKQYRAIADGGTTSAATFAKLGLASVLYDQGKYADAKNAYQAVKDSKLAAADLGVKGRALEGVGLSLEAAGDKDAALKAFGELSNVDGLGFNALGAYHQARLAFAAGQTEKAKEFLKDAQKRLDTLTAGTDAKKALGAGPTGYLQQTVRDLQRRVDPTAVTASPNTLTAEQIQELTQQMGGAGDGKGLSTEKLKELLKNMGKTPGGAPNVPAPPASAP